MRRAEPTVEWTEEDGLALAAKVDELRVARVRAVEAARRSEDATPHSDARPSSRFDLTPEERASARFDWLNREQEERELLEREVLERRKREHVLFERGQFDRMAAATRRYGECMSDISQADNNAEAKRLASRARRAIFAWQSVLQDGGDLARLAHAEREADHAIDDLATHARAVKRESREDLERRASHARGLDASGPSVPDDRWREQD